MRHGYLTLLASAALFATTTHAGPTWKYFISDVQVVDLGTMGGEESVASDINDQGEIVGWSHVQQGWRHAFLWRNGSMEDITPYEQYTAEARGINNLTQVVGYLQHPAGETTFGFYWDARVSMHLLDSAYTDVASIGWCASGSDAKAINDSGVITGVRIGGCGPPVPFADRAARWTSWSALWQELVPLGPSGKENYAYNINSAGTIVGWNKNGDYPTAGFDWSAGVYGEVPFPAVVAPVLPEPGQMKAYGINDSGAIVGVVTLRHTPPLDETTTRAFYWNGKSPQASLLSPIGDAGLSAAFEVNDNNFSVGYRDNRDRWAVVWHAHFGGHALPVPPGPDVGSMALGKHCEALAVNNRNASGLVQAVGYCKIGGDRHAVLWNITTLKVFISAPMP
jgi:probable HAF family extracellular repeat protein